MNNLYEHTDASGGVGIRYRKFMESLLACFGQAKAGGYVNMKGEEYDVILVDRKRLDQIEKEAEIRGSRAMADNLKSFFGPGMDNDPRMADSSWTLRQIVDKALEEIEKEHTP